MPAPTTASPTLRRVLRGSALGIGLLVTTGVVATPALASPAPGIDGLLESGAPGVMPVTGTAGPPAGDSAPVGEGSPAGASSSSTEQAQPLTPDFGVGKNLDVHLSATSVPADLDLSGARFEVVDMGGKTQASCTTGANGSCPIQLAHFDPAASGFPLVTDVPPGTYLLRQDPAYAVPGLVPSAVATPFIVCSPFTSTAQCQPGFSWAVPNTSLFRAGLAVTVRDATTHAPLAGASYSLTGADYRHLHPTDQDQVTIFPQAPGNKATPGDSSAAASSTAATASGGSADPASAADQTGDTAATDTAASDTAASSTAAAETTTQAQDSATDGSTPSGSTSGPVVSGPDGLLTYRGWFLDGEWELAPEVIPPGYRSSGVLPVILPVRSRDSGDIWADTVGLAPEDVVVTGTGGSGIPVPPVAPRAPIPSGAPTAPRTTAAKAQRVRAAPQPSAGAPAASASAISAVPAPAAGRSPADPSGAPLPAAAPAPGSSQLRVAAKTSLLHAGLIGFGVLFVALTVLGVGFMRRRARG